MRSGDAAFSARISTQPGTECACPCVNPRAAVRTHLLASGDYGKPRPAVIVQTDALPTGHASVVICQVTSECSDAPDFRVTIDPTEKNGLRARSQVMADKPVTVWRERIGRQVGHLDDKDISRLNIALAFVTGLAD